MNKIVLAALGAGLFAPLPAVAGGMVTPVAEPVLAAPVMVTPRVNWTGPYAGVSLGYGDVNATGDVLDGNGAIGGAFVGYRQDFGTWVGGIEGDWDATDISLGEDAGDLDSVARLKLQAGGAMGRAFLYATAGAAYADASALGTDYSDWGYFVGVGMDYEVAPQWTVGGEILAHKFDGFDDTDLDLDATTVKARLAYRF